MTECAATCADPGRVGAELASALSAARNPGGGWGYRSGNRSRIEPTCWARLALGNGAYEPTGVDILRNWRRHDGWLIDVAGAPANVGFNALAALTLLQTPSTASLADVTISRLVDAKGTAIPQDRALRQDNSLQAWSWVDGTFSWVEPTAWCLLLLKQRRARGPLPRAVERIEVAERMLLDRACSAGGWNYGNPHVLGQDLLPYVPTTSLALLAMQDRVGDPIVQRALDGLQKDAARERSAVALAWTIICLRVYGQNTAAWEQELAGLVARDRPAMGRTDDIVGLAMSVYVLGHETFSAFTVPVRKHGD
jgi:hypothetical protein